MAKAQGLPISFIVLAAISALVLILVVAFTVGGLGGFFKQLVAPAPEEITTVQTACNTYCSQLASVSTTGQFKGSSFCTKTFAVDLNRNGKINSTDEAGLHCWGGKLLGSCTSQVGNDVMTEVNCTGYAVDAAGTVVK